MNEKHGEKGKDQVKTFSEAIKTLQGLTVASAS